MSSTTTATPSPYAISPLLVPQPYRVLDKVKEGEHVWTLHIAPVDGALPPFEPAQVSMLGAFGVGEAAISISSAAGNSDYHAYTIRRAGPITNALVDTPIGGLITVRGPFGSCWPLDRLDTGALAIIAGGLGLAPLRAVIDRAVHRLDRLDRLGIVLGAKTPSDLIYRADLDRWRKAGAQVTLTVDAGDDEWNGSVGLVPDLLGATPGLDMEWADTTAFVCGPDVMMHFTAVKLLDLGVPVDRIWMTLERNMQCGNGLCGHCQLGPFIVCRDGPVVNYAEVAPFHRIQEL